MKSFSCERIPVRCLAAHKLYGPTVEEMHDNFDALMRVLEQATEADKAITYEEDVVQDIVFATVKITD